MATMKKGDIYEAKIKGRKQRVLIRDSELSERGYILIGRGKRYRIYASIRPAELIRGPLNLCYWNCGVEVSEPGQVCLACKPAYDESMGFWGPIDERKAQQVG